jgi:tRNA uridine 5-carboxymethylaminomethyl modification enzyme
MLREDNADQRLTPIAREFGLIDDVRWMAFESKMEALEKELDRLKQTWIYPAHAEAKKAEELMALPLSKEQSLFDLLKRPNVAYNALAELEVFGDGVDSEAVVDQIEIEAKYSGYIERQKQEIDKMKRSESVKIPEDLDLDKISGLSNEVKQKLRDHKPATLGMAGRISGITPAAISILLISIKKHRAGNKVA